MASLPELHANHCLRHRRHQPCGPCPYHLYDGYVSSLSGDPLPFLTAGMTVACLDAPRRPAGAVEGATFRWVSEIRDAPARQGPRAAQTIFEVTLRLLAAHGYSRLTIEAVAAEAGVNRTTIYRWWPSKAALVRSAVLHSRILEIEIPSTGALRDDLVEMARALIDLLRGDDTGPVVRAILSAAVGEPELAVMSRQFFGDRLERFAPLVDRAVRRGELPEDVDVMLLSDVIGGSVWFRTMLRQEPVGSDFAERVADAALAGLRGVPQTGGAAVSHRPPEDPASSNDLSPHRRHR
jgi:AcrR family transcriptional regulator